MSNDEKKVTNCLALKGTTYKRDCQHHFEKIVRFSAVNRSKTKDEVWMTYDLDLSNLSEEEILENCAANLNIRWMRKQEFELKSTDELLQATGESYDVVKFRPMRSKLTDVQKAEKLLSKLTDEQKQAIAISMGLEMTKKAD